MSDNIFKLKLHPGQYEVYSRRSRFKVLVAGRRFGKCVARGTMISMASGSNTPVENVKSGDLILTMNEKTYQMEEKRVRHVHDNGVKDVIVINTKRGKKLVVTPNHPILANNVWTEAEKISVGDLLASPKKTVFGSKELPSHEVDLLAIWLAEGRKYSISNTTPEILKIMKHVSDSLGGGLEMKNSCGKGVDWTFYSGNRSGGSQSGVKNTMRLAIDKYGLWGRDSKTKFIPDEIFNLPKYQLARFLNLFVACDGSINKKGKNVWAIEVGLANELMIGQLSDLFLKFGIRGNVYKKVHNAKSSVSGRNFVSWSLVISEKKSVMTFCKQIGAISKENAVNSALTASTESKGSCNSYLPIHHDELVKHLEYEPVSKGKFGGHNAVVARDLPEYLRQQLTSWRKQNRSRISTRRYENIRGYSDGFFNPIADGDFLWDEVVSVESAGSSHTYDLTVEGNHNFISEGIVTHNTVLAKTTIARAIDRENQYIWYVAPSYRMAKQIMWRDMVDSVPRRWLKKRPNETSLQLSLINGTVVELKGADDPDSLRGVGLNFIVLDEFQDMRPEVWTEVLRPTLAATGGGALFIGTPKSYNHLYDLWVLGQKPELRKSGQWYSWQFPTITSPFIPESEIEQARHDMDEKSFRQEFLASFETMSGRVYYPFDRKHNVSDEVRFDPQLPIWIGQDFNIDPMSSAVMQPQPNGELWAVDEIVLQGSNTEETCDEIDRRYWRYQKNITIYPDASGGSRQHARGETDLDVFREKGFSRIKHRRKNPNVADRVNAFNRMITSADGDIRFKVNPKCKNLIESLEQTIYKPGCRDIDKSMNVEHITDAAGYCIEYEYPVRKINIAGLSL